MLFGFLLIFFLFVREAAAQSLTSTATITFTTTDATTHSSTGTPPPHLRVVAIPDYPVAAGQKVTLRCSSLPSLSESVQWFWEHLQNDTWTRAGTTVELTLTKPEDSGLYRCSAETSGVIKAVSPNHTVYIISTQATVGENLGIAAFVLCLLGLFLLALLVLLAWLRRGDTQTTSSPETKGCPRPEVASKGDLPQADSDATDVYMNYTNTNPGYTDLDPANITEDNVYSSL